MTIRGAVSGPFVYPYPSFYPSCFLLSVRTPVQKSTCEETIVPISFNLYCKKDLPLLVYIVVPIIVKNSPCEWPLIFFYQPGKEVVIRFLASGWWRTYGNFHMRDTSLLSNRTSLPMEGRKDAVKGPETQSPRSKFLARWTWWKALFSSSFCLWRW